MKDSLQIVGTNESFIYESKTEGDSDEIIEKVYSIKMASLANCQCNPFRAVIREIHSLSNIPSSVRRFSAIITAKI